MGEQQTQRKGEDGPEWVVRSKFKGELANFRLEKKFHTKGVREMFNQHHKGMHEQFSQILSTIEKSEIPEPEAPTFAITTRSGISTRDPPFPAPSQLTLADEVLCLGDCKSSCEVFATLTSPANHAEEAIEKEGPEGAESSSMDEEAPRSSIFYQPSKSLNLPFPSRVKKQKKGEEVERLLSIFKQIHINLPFLEAMIHMLKGAKVLKDLLSHKEKLKKAASSVKLSEECYAII
ncbi:hypothetical protein Tco_0451098 [Tanacetum coccineum]